ncbi:hypothetical protein HGA92_00650 [Candidatus Gracilibacteria bacterium]|nr:hypothetical protein [Candidatus Gracilibacteria bacterium]NUJ98882.1 hypothetical protein [Candidatus Gracilibacteria bacterium]
MEKIIETRICIHCGASFDITDKDLEFYEKVSPVFPNPGVSFSTPRLKQSFPPREKGVKENISLNGGGIKEAVSQRPVSFHETGLNGEKSPDSFFESGFKDLGNGKVKYLIPSPTLCPDCRQQRRLSFRNERKLYKRKCDATGEDIISIYSPDKPYKVYNQDFWWSDRWDALDYGKDFDFGKSFFDQFEELMKEVPLINLNTINNENSLYVHLSGYNKNCYLVFAGEYNEDCLYCSRIINSKNCIDNVEISNSSLLYHCINVENCNNLFFSQNCKNCSFSDYLYECESCSDCLFCNNLVGKKYNIFNKQFSKEEYKNEKKKILSQNDLRKMMIDLLKKSIHKSSTIINSENCIGNNIFSSKNCKKCFDTTNTEDASYTYASFKTKKIMDVTNTTEQFFGYEGMSIGYNSINSLFTIGGWTSNFVYYCFDVHNSSHLFGCIGLKNKSYCILNKQYTKSEYEVLIPKIIEHMMKTGEWGEFFPSSLSPFGYNETVAQEYYPLTRRDVIPAKAGIYENENISSETGLEGKINYIDREGNTYKTLQEAGKRPVFKWSNYEAPFPKVEKIIPASKLPENIADIPDDILNWAIECEVTKKPFRIIKEELAFYRKHNLPIPRRHPDQRHLNRMSLRNPRKLFARICDNCKKDIQTTYAPERPEIVYCEECYNKEVY